MLQWTNPFSRKPPAPPVVVKTAEELTQLLPRWQCDRCGYQRSGDPYGCKQCPNHYGDRVPYRQVSGIEWEAFALEVERHDRHQSDLIYKRTGGEGWQVQFDATIGKYALFPPGQNMSTANPADGTHEWTWAEIIDFVIEHTFR